MTHATTLHRAVMAVTATTLIGASGVAGQVGNNMGVLNPNLAGEDEIRALPHMTAELAGTVVAERPFLTMSELHAVLSATLSEETASREEILLVPGVGPRMAREFDEYRPYRRIEQFRREIGKYVDDEEVAQLEQYVFVPIDLNTASDEDILSIPGVGPRMLREFKEYRPYRSIEQFRREIGKYVSDEEVARMERYVVVGQGGQEGQ
jgi:DNA uptake protein ComE-like DNA-binding protein